jgi:hypothetical protein
MHIYNYLIYIYFNLENKGILLNLTVVFYFKYVSYTSDIYNTHIIIIHHHKKHRRKQKQKRKTFLVFSLLLLLLYLKSLK